MSVKLPAQHRLAVYLGLGVVSFSGLAWFALHDLFALRLFETMHALLVLHGITAAIALVLVGSLLPLHMRLAWRMRRNRKSGTVSISIIAVLGVTGLLLYYASEEWRDPARWAHIAVGILLTIVVPAHVWLGRRASKSVAGIGLDLPVVRRERNSQAFAPCPTREH